jgi:uncharacterized protein YcfL
MKKLSILIIAILLVGCSATHPEQAILTPFTQTQIIHPTEKLSVIDTSSTSDTSEPTATSTVSYTPTFIPIASTTQTEAQQDNLSEFEGKINVGGYEMYLHCVTILPAKAGEHLGKRSLQ